MTRLVDLRESPLDPLEAERSVTHSGAGAVVSFVGRVRDHNEGRPVVRLEYEAYHSMALREMTQIVEEIEQRLKGTSLAVIHRVGLLEVGDAAIICAASAPHRSEAFDACRMLIDKVKAHVPIWKREYGPDGPYWIGWHDARCASDHEYLHDHKHDREHDHGHAHDQATGLHHEHHHNASPGIGDAKRLDGFRIVCITVSDTRTLESDESGAVAERLLSEVGAVVERQLVRDDAATISTTITRCLAETPDALLLTGGTGIGPRDVTCEALRPLLCHELHGFGEQFRRLSFDEIGPRALLSRTVAGTIGRTLVFAIPGSPKAVRLALERLIMPFLPHARSMLLGGGH